MSLMASEPSSSFHTLACPSLSAFLPACFSFVPLLWLLARQVIVLEDTEEYIQMSDKSEVKNQQRVAFPLQVVCRHLHSAFQSPNRLSLACD